MAVGFCRTEVLPFPKFQLHPVAPPVERSWKCTIRGEHPESGAPEKLAEGTCACKLLTEKQTAISAISLERIWFIKGFNRWLFWFSTMKVARCAKTVPDYYLFSELFSGKKHLHFCDLQTPFLFKRQGTDRLVLLTKKLCDYYCLSSRIILVSLPTV